jgi:hypothetical protein
MFVENIRRILEGTKTTTLRPLKCKYEIGSILVIEGTKVRVKITDRRQILIPDELSPEIARGEGYKSVQEMVDLLKLDRLARSMPRWLYTFALVPPTPDSPEMNHAQRLY